METALKLGTNTRFVPSARFSYEVLDEAKLSQKPTQVRTPYGITFVSW